MPTDPEHELSGCFETTRDVWLVEVWNSKLLSSPSDGEWV